MSFLAGILPVPTEPDRLLGSEKKRILAVFALKPGTRSFWMMPKLSYIVIINLIANLTFLYHKPQKPAVTCID